MILSLIVSTLDCVNKCASDNLENKDILYQYSTIEALLEGIYDGNMTFSELKKHGNYGLGTINSLDGEMIQVNGEFYQIKVDGIAYPIADNAKTPFAIVTFFDIDKSIRISDTMDYNQFNEYIDNNIPTNNLFYLVIVEGNFDYIKTRSVPKQERPYPTLVKAIENQRFFEFNNVKGSLVGFRIPNYIGNMNVPEYHFHFLTEDKKEGGHVLALRIHDQEVHIDYTNGFFMKAPDTEDFYNLYSEKYIGEDVKIVESNK